MDTVYYIDLQLLFCEQTMWPSFASKEQQESIVVIVVVVGANRERRLTKVLLESPASRPVESSRSTESNFFLAAQNRIDLSEKSKSSKARYRAVGNIHTSAKKGNDVARSGSTRC